MILDISVTVYPLRGGITVKFSKNAQKNSCRFRMYDQLPSFKTFPSAEFKSNRKLAKMSFAQMRGENGPKTRRVTLSLSLHPPAAFSSLPERQRVRSTLRSYSFFGSQNRYHNFNSGFLETPVFETVCTLQDELFELVSLS